jgi:thiamine-monophosphate kinase
LLADAGHLCEASDVGVVVDRAAIPRAPGVDEVITWLGDAPLGLPSGGGDDYELLIAVPSERAEGLARAVAPTPLTVIGRFIEEPGLRTEDGSPLEPRGWDHFAGNR